MSALPVVSIPELWKSTGDQKNDKWSIARLIALSKDLPVFEATMAGIATDYTLTSAAELLTAPRGSDPRLDALNRPTTSQRRQTYKERMDAKTEARAELERERAAGIWAAEDDEG